MKKWLFLLRAFFPSWKFFDDVGPELRLEVRFGNTPKQLGGWQNALPPILRSFKNLLFNPYGNYLHACHNLLNHFNSEIAEADLTKPELLLEKTSYKITRRLARFQVEKLISNADPFVYQFRLSANYVDRSSDEILTSPVCED